LPWSQPNARNLRESCVAFYGEFLLVRAIHCGQAGTRGAARALTGCGNGGRCRPAAPQLARYTSLCPNPGLGIPGADHDRGHLRTKIDRNCPRS
jgi:hypothetical protein